MVWYLIILYRRSPREPDKVACDYEHPAHSTILLWAHAQLKCRKRFVGKTKVNGPKWSKFEKGRHSWQWAKHARLYSDLYYRLEMGNVYGGDLYFSLSVVRSAPCCK